MAGPWEKYRSGGPQAVPANPIKVQDAMAGISNTQANTNRTNVQTAKDVRDLRQTPISADDQKIIDAMRQNVGNMNETLNLFHGAAGVIDRFKTGPDRAAAVKDAVTPPEGGIWDSLRARFYRNLLGVPQQDVDDYQALQRYAQEGVLQKQIAQKGPQTESDAIRMLISGVSPDKNVNLNAKIIGDATLGGLVAQKKPSFYTEWANRNGSIGALQDGKTVDQAWQEAVDRAYKKYNSDARITRLQGQGGGQSKVIRFDENGNRLP